MFSCIAKLTFGFVFFIFCPMKKYIIYLTLSVLLFSEGFAQTNYDRNTWMVGLGVNTVNSLGTRGPFNSIDDWGFTNPFSFSLEHRWYTDFALEANISLNGFESTDRIDSFGFSEDETFFTTNIKAKYYFDDLIFYRSAYWLDLAINGGLGIFKFEEVNTSINLGLDATAWVSEDFGIAFKSLAKFAINHKSSGLDNNHYQYFLEVIYRFN